MGSSSTAYQQVGASEKGVGVSGSSGTTIARDGAIALGNNAKLNTGLEVGNASGSQFTVGYDAGALQTALQQVGTNTVNAVNAAQAASQKNLDAVLAKLATDAKAPAAKTDPKTDEASPPGINWWLWGGLAAGAFALYHFFRK